jgi:hypothetical protein
MTLRRAAQAALLLLCAAALVVVLLRTIPFPSSQSSTSRYDGRHDIGVRDGRLYDRRTGRMFVVRGWNYVRLGPQETAAGRIVYHTTFNAGRYDPARAERALRSMRASGYNAVRVFLNAVCLRGCLVDRRSGDLSNAYLKNVADFIRRAAAERVYVLLTIDHIPASGRYGELLRAGQPGRVAGVNLVFLADGGVRASAAFWRDLVGRLARMGAPLGAVLGYELQNEVAFAPTEPPLSLRTGTLKTPAGRVYRLSSAAERRQMLADGLVHWLDATRAAIRAVDSTALVGVGFAQPFEPDSTRALLARAAIERSQVDFVDVHAYPGVGLAFSAYAAEAGFAASRKPLVMGEVGAFRAAYPTAADAAAALEEQLLRSCRYRFAGWLAWSWNTQDQPELWSARSDGGALQRALAPRTWPDPCAHAPTPASSSNRATTTSESK